MNRVRPDITPQDPALPGDPGEIREFQQRVRDYLDGSLGPDEFKKCRLQLGIYGIRGLKDKQMVRVKVPSGRLTASQLERLADLAEHFATGRAHVTTRQDVQLYEVPVERAPEVLRLLAEVGLTSREACGNSVRNVTACPFAGLCADELFDVTPYSLAVTRHFLRNPMSQALPRKFKISFSGCAHDCAMAAIHDIGAVAATHGDNGRTAYGFKLYVGGGLGAIPRVAQLFEPFTAIERLLPTFEAIIRVFDQHGERKNKSRARMKFLIERIGMAEFQRLVLAAREELERARGGFPALPVPEPVQAAESNHPAPASSDTNGVARWIATNTQAQRQTGYHVVTVRLPLGDMSVEQMRALARISAWCSRGQLIITQWQDLCLPWVESQQRERLYGELVKIGLALPEAQRIQDVTACPGADTCQIGITASRGLARAVTELLEQPEYKSDTFKDLRIKMSGCPNSCGQHHIADIGFYGAARTIEGRLVPHYQMLIGGLAEDGRAAFGQPVVKLPAKHVPQALACLLQFYQRDQLKGEPFRAFVQRVGIPTLQNLLQNFTIVRVETEAPDVYRDWGQTVAFSLGGMGQGECAA